MTASFERIRCVEKPKDERSGLDDVREVLGCVYSQVKLLPASREENNHKNNTILGEYFN